MKYTTRALTQTDTSNTLLTILHHGKRGVASCLFNHVRTVDIGENVGKEEIYGTEILMTSGDPEQIIRSAMRPRKKRQEEERPKYTICLPHVSALSEDLRIGCRRYYIRTVFTTISTL